MPVVQYSLFEDAYVSAHDRAQQMGVPVNKMGRLLMLYWLKHGTPSTEELNTVLVEDRAMGKRRGGPPRLPID